MTRATAINVLPWEAATSLFSGCCSPAAPKPARPSQGFRWKELARFTVADERQQGHGREIRGARVDILAGSAVAGPER